MSSYMKQSCFVTEPLVRFFPTQACGNQCKVTWSRVENLACAHGVRRSPQCGGDCRRTLSEQKLCLHATVFCSLCGESRWPEHSCYCFNEQIDKRWVFLVTLLHGHNYQTHRLGVLFLGWIMFCFTRIFGRPLGCGDVHCELRWLEGEQCSHAYWMCAVCGRCETAENIPTHGHSQI